MVVYGRCPTYFTEGKRVKVAKWQKLGVVSLWLGVLAAFWIYASTHTLSPGEVLRALLHDLQGHALAPLYLLLIYLLRPLLLLPTTLLTVASGFLFGPFWGFLYAGAATLLSSALAYALGRYFAAGTPELDAKFVQRLRARSFETVLLSRLLALPGDLVNYAAGFLRISAAAFLLGTALGGVPGLLMGVLAGASLEGLAGGVRLNVPYLALSAALLLLSLGVAHVLRRRGAAADISSGGVEEQKKRSLER